MKASRLFLLVLMVVLSATCSKTREQVTPPLRKDPFSLRVYTARDVGQMTRVNATFTITGAFSFASGDPWKSCRTREEFERRMGDFQAFTRECRKRGITVISYVSKTIRKPESKGGLYDIWENRWDEYRDYFGPRPAVHPRKWLAVRADGSLWGHTHVPPSKAATFLMPKTPTERAGCDLNPFFRQYMKGIIKIVCETGVDGIYLDHTENKCGYCEYCRKNFLSFLKENYPADFFREVYRVSNLDDIKIPTRDTDPFYREFRKWRARTGAEFHKFVRDYAREMNPGFIMSGNAYSANGFTAAIGSADMEMLGEIDDIPYSEIAVSSSFERGKARVPHMEGGVRISNSPHYKHFRAMVGLEKPILVYPLYPESPNPVPRERALYPIIRLVIGECIAHGLTFRRVQPNHSPYVLLSAFDFYRFLAGNQDRFLGQRLYADVAVLSSLNQFYSNRYSFFYSVSRALTDAGINHRIVTEKALNYDGLKPFKVLVLPYVPLMDDEQVLAVEKYVKRGGGVVVMGSSSSHDEFGQPRGKLALSGMLGFSLDNLPGTVIRRSFGKGRVVYIPLPAERMREENLDYREYGVRHSWFSRGAFPADMVAALTRVPAEVAWAADGQVVPVLGKPGWVEATLMKNSAAGKYLLHLVNYRVTIDGDVAPEYNVLVKIPLDGGEKVKSVRYLTPDSAGERELPFIVRPAGRGKRNLVYVVVPELNIYGALEVSLG